MTDMTQPPDLQKSMTDAIESGFTKVSEVQNQIAALAAQIEVSKKAMIRLDKLHRRGTLRQQLNLEEAQ